MKRTFYLTFFLISIPYLGLAQQLIKGKVVAQSTNEPLPGVNIVVKETSTGTVSDRNGEFKLEIDPAVNNIIVISFVGFNAKTIDLNEVDNLLNLNIYLQEKMIGLDEVVISGQGDNISKRRLSTEVASVDGQSLRENTQHFALTNYYNPNYPTYSSNWQAGSRVQLQSSGPGGLYLLLLTQPPLFI